MSCDMFVFYRLVVCYFKDWSVKYQQYQYDKFIGTVGFTYFRIPPCNQLHCTKLKSFYCINRLSLEIIQEFFRTKN